MIDSLVQFLLDEIAMDGAEGTALSAIDGFTQDYFARASGLSSSNAPTCRPATQNSDARFRCYVWNTLLNQPGVIVGVILPSDDENLEVQPKASTSSRKAQTDEKVPFAAYVWSALPAHEAKLGRQKLIDLYGDSLRLSAGAEASYVAITRRHERPSSMTEKVFELVQLAARARGEGVTTLEIGKALDKKQGSAHHYLKTAVSLGIVKKFRVTSAGMRTSRIVHVRYLSVSKAWAVYMASDDAVDSDEAVASSDDEDQGSTGRKRLTRINNTYLATNPEFIKGRIVRALKQRQHQRMPHTDVVTAIGLYDHQRRDLRALNSIIERMVEAGVLLKVKVEQRSATKIDETVSVPHVELVESEATEDLVVSADLAAQIEDSAQTEYASPLGTIPIDRQVLDLLGDTGGNGLRNNEISALLGGYTTRTIDQVLKKLTESLPPPALGDLHVKSSLDLVGREKFLRWFLLIPYLDRCEREKTEPLKAVAPNFDAIGGWLDVDPVDFYADVDALAKFQRKSFQSSMKKVFAPSRASVDARGLLDDSPPPPRRLASTSKAKLAKPINSIIKELTPAEREKLEERALAEDKIAAAEAAKAGTETYYARTKREKAARAALGLPPKEKRPPSGGGRKAKIQPVEAASNNISEAGSSSSRTQNVKRTISSSPEVEGTEAIDAAPSIDVEPVSSRGLSAATGKLSEKAAGKRKAIDIVDEETASGSKKKKKPTRRSTPPLDLASLTRQNLIIAYITHHGGIIDKVGALPQLISDFKKEHDPTSPPFLMDRSVCKRAIAKLVERMLCKETTITTGTEKHARQDLIYLSSIALDSPQFVEYANRPAVDVYMVSQSARQIKAEVEEVSTIPAEPLSATADAATIRAHFAKHPEVLGARFGCHFGRFARARELHRYIIGQFVAPSSSSRDSEVISYNHIVAQMPLSVFIRVIPLAIDAPELDAFLAEKGNLYLTIGSLPTNIRRLIKPHRKKRFKAIFVILRSLVDLRLLEPLVIDPNKASDDGQERVLHYDATSNEKSATHWLVHRVAPVYAFFNQDDHLVSILPVDSIDACDHFWTALHSASFKPSDGKKLLHPDFTTIYSGNLGHRTHIISSTKWLDSYYLQPAQRKHIAAFANRVEDPITLESFDHDRRCELAECLFAPEVAVEEYLVVLQKRRRPTEPRKRQKKNGDDGEDVPRVEARPRKPRIDVKRAIFDGIVQRFRIDHNDVELNPYLVNYLRIQYCLPSSSLSSGTDSGNSALNAELCILADIPTAPTPRYQSIVPAKEILHSLQPYDPEESVTSRPKAKVAEAVSSAVLRPEWRAEDMGTQREFLTGEPLKHATLAKGQRRVGELLSREQRDLLYDAVAIMRARAKYLNAHNVKWRPASILFQNVPEDKLRNFITGPTESDAEKNYLIRLEHAWNAVWDANREQLPDPYPTDQIKFDLAPFVRCLRANVDKQTLRLAGPDAHAPTLEHLPASFAALTIEYDIDAPAAHSRLSSRFDGLFRGITGSQQRLSDFGKIPLSAPAQEVAPSKLISQDILLAMAVTQMVLVTPQDRYNDERARSLLLSHKDSIVKANEILMDRGIAVATHSEEARRVPGRNNFFTDKYIASFDGILSGRLDEANSVYTDLVNTDKATRWSLTVDDGEMVALLELASNNNVDMDLDAASTKLQRLPDDGFKSRKVADKFYELGVLITPGSAVPATFHPVMAPPADLDLTADPALLSEVPFATVDMATVNDAIVASGFEGVAVDDLVECCTLTRSNVLVAIAGLVETTPPLAFWCGNARLVVVSSQHLDHWTIAIPLAISQDMEDGSQARRRVFPASWIDIDGQVVDQRWSQALCWVRSQLFTSPGLTSVAIYRQAQQHLYLSMYEVYVLLKTLFAEGVVSYKGVETKDVVDYDQVCWLSQ